MSVESRPNRKGEDLHFRIHEKDVAALKRVAERNDRSMSAEVRRAIRAYVAAQDLLEERVPGCEHEGPEEAAG